MSTERPEVAAAISSAACGRTARGPLLPLALQVEQRVVDTDCEPDQEHHRRSLHRDGEHEARESDESEGREYGSQREQERNPCRNQRAEGEHEHGERDRQREHPRLAEIFGVRGLDSLLSARVAELADREPRVGLLRGRHAVEHGRDLVDRLLLLTADVELHERGVPVLRDQASVARVERGPDVANVRHLRNACDDVGDRGVEGGRAYASRAALDEDVLGGGLLEAGLEDPIHAARLARSGGVVDVSGSDHAAEPERDQDESEPAERCGLPVSGAPTSHARCEVVRPSGVLAVHRSFLLRVHAA